MGLDDTGPQAHQAAWWHVHVGGRARALWGTLAH